MPEEAQRHLAAPGVVHAKEQHGRAAVMALSSHADKLSTDSCQEPATQPLI
jgi:hypothetical protein